MELLQSGLCPQGNKSNQLSPWRNRQGEEPWWGCALQEKKSGTVCLQGEFTEWVPSKMHKEMGYQQWGTCALPPWWAGTAVGGCLCCCSHGSLAAVSVGQLRLPEYECCVPALDCSDVPPIAQIPSFLLICFRNDLATSSLFRSWKIFQAWERILEFWRIKAS